MSRTPLGEWLGVKRNQIIQIIHQNIRFWPKSYPWFQFRPKFWLNNLFRHCQGRNQISNSSFLLLPKPKSKASFGFGSACFKYNFGSSLIKGYRIKGSRTKGPEKKGPAASLYHFQFVPHNIQSLPKGTLFKWWLKNFQKFLGWQLISVKEGPWKVYL